MTEDCQHPESTVVQLAGEGWRWCPICGAHGRAGCWERPSGEGLALQISRTEMADLVLVIEHFLRCEIITSERRQRCQDLLVKLRRGIEKHE
jgi:hypothetical protein